MDSLQSAVARLEACTARLEGLQAGGGQPTSTPAAEPQAAHYSRSGSEAGIKPAAPAAAAPANSGANDAAAAVLRDWDAQIGPALAQLQTATDLPPEVLKVGHVVIAAFEGERGIVDAISQCQPPEPEKLQGLVGPVGQRLGEAQSLAEDRRSPALHQAKAAAEALQSLTWVVYSGPSCGMNPPPQHVLDGWQSAEFWANKVLREHRATSPAQVAWIGALKGVVMAMHGFVKQHHPDAVRWNKAGCPLSEFKPSASGSTSPASSPSQPQSQASQPQSQPHSKLAPAARKPGPPAAPPPPPPGSLLKDRASPGGTSGGPAKPAGGMSAIFSALNQGSAVTQGLKKVTDDMKTKNRADRPGMVSATAKPSSAEPGTEARGLKKAPTGKEPKLALEQGGRKWVVEGHTDNRDIVLQDVDPKQAVYIFGCTSCTIQVQGKVNMITLDQCRKTGLVFQDLVAACEIVNCTGVQVQATGTVKTLAIDKCDGVQIYLAQPSHEAEIMTAKSSEMNIVLLHGDDQEPSEHALPEQFLSQYKNGKFTTTPVSHAGG